jgi:hypothetical protein
MGWGEEINIKGSWKFVKLSEIDADFKEKYKLDGKVLRKIQNSTSRECKEDGDKKKAKQIRGLFVPDKDGKSYDDLSDIEQIFLSQEIFYLLRTKYNFIHYNPFPKVKKTSIKELQDSDGEEDEDIYLLDENDKKTVKTNNDLIVKDLEKRLKFNRKNFNVESPFYGECVIIDEVHNFVREILNNSGPSRIFYEWIVNAENVKLVFLSGTPVINKPAEIAILYNMLKGNIKIYSFTIKTDMDTEVITKRLNLIFYENKKSLVELLYVEKKGGKVVISFIQERTNYESVMNPDDKNNIIYTVQSKKEGVRTFDEFMTEIYKGLNQVFKKDEIIPSKETYDELTSRSKNALLKGKPVVYDKEVEIHLIGDRPYLRYLMKMINW